MHTSKVMNKTLALCCISMLPIYAHSTDKLPKITVHATTVDQNDPQHLTTRLQWVKFPQISYLAHELNNQDRSAIIRVQTDLSGNVVDAEVQEGTGIRALDQKLVQAVKQAKIKPFKKNGKAVAIVGYQTFSLNLENAEDRQQSKSKCTYHFNSENWIKQEKNKSVAFRYLKQPELSLEQNQLKYKDRVVKFRFKVNQQGEIQQVKLTKHSGVNAIDQQVVEAVEHSKVEVKRTYRNLWIYKPSNFSDEVHFNMKDCH